MYKVWQDPEGTKYLDTTNPFITSKSMMTSENEEVYKRRVEGLNEEIKSLNYQLEMVNAVHYQCVWFTSYIFIV